MDAAAAIQERVRGMFPELLGIRFLEAGPNRVRAEMVSREALCTLPGLVHGGALMAFADTLGAAGTILNLPDGAGTTTIESKTNFIAAAPNGKKLIGVSEPLHRGRQTQVWQTRISLEDGKLVAIVTQTQMVLPVG
jgi:1,4-dihydroxy-2-naphthoyl-CoA hydrolase